MKNRLLVLLSRCRPVGWFFVFGIASLIILGVLIAIASAVSYLLASIGLPPFIVAGGSALFVMGGIVGLILIYAPKKENATSPKGD